MSVTVDDTNLPWCVAYGTAAEVAGHLKNQNVGKEDVINIVHDGSNFYAFFRKGP